MEKKRIQYIDFYKFIGITLMIMGHVGFGDAFDKFIHAFHMPLFFVASGFCFSTGLRFKDFLKRKIISLVVPYCIFSCLTFLLLRNINDISIEQMNHVIWINNLSTPIAGVWFLTALFWANIIYYFIVKQQNNDIRWFFSGICLLIGYSLESTTGFILPWSLSQGLIGVFYIHIGKTVFNNITAIDDATMLNSLIGIAFTIVLIFTNDPVNLRTLESGNIALCVFNASAMCFFILILCHKTQAFQKCKIYEIACRIGQYSIGYLCFNQIVIRYVKEVVKHFFAESTVSNIIILVLSYLLMFSFTEFLVHTRLSILLGINWTKRK